MTQLITDRVTNTALALDGTAESTVAAASRAVVAAAVRTAIATAPGGLSSAAVQMLIADAISDAVLGTAGAESATIAPSRRTVAAALAPVVRDTMQALTTATEADTEAGLASDAVARLEPLVTAARTGLASLMSDLQLLTVTLPYTLTVPAGQGFGQVDMAGEYAFLNEFGNVVLEHADVLASMRLRLYREDGDGTDRSAFIEGLKPNTQFQFRYSPGRVYIFTATGPGVAFGNGYDIPIRDGVYVGTDTSALLSPGPAVEFRFLLVGAIDEMNRLGGEVAALRTDLTGKADAGVVTTLQGEVAANDQDITALGSRVTAAEASVATKAEAMALDTLRSEVAANDLELSAVTSRTTQLETDLADKADASAVQGLRTDLTEAEADIAANASAITALEARSGAQLGPAPNTFTGDTRAEAIAARDAQAAADETWFQRYKANPNNAILINWT